FRGVDTGDRNGGVRQWIGRAGQTQSGKQRVFHAGRQRHIPERTHLLLDHRAGRILVDGRGLGRGDGGDLSGDLILKTVDKRLKGRHVGGRRAVVGGSGGQGCRHLIRRRQKLSVGKCSYTFRHI